MAMALGQVSTLTRGNAVSANGTAFTVTGGSAIVSVWWGAAERTISFSDDKGNSYTTQNFDDPDTGHDVAVALALNVAAGSTTPAFNNNGAATDYDFVSFEITGNFATGGGFDGTAATVLRLADTTPITASITTTVQAFVCGLMSCLGNGNTPGTLSPNNSDATPTTGWVEIAEEESAASGEGGSLIYQILGAGTYAAGWQTTVGNNLTLVFAIKEGSAAGPPMLTFPRWGSVRR